MNSLMKKPRATQPTDFDVHQTRVELNKLVRAFYHYAEQAETYFSLNGSMYHEGRRVAYQNAAAVVTSSFPESPTKEACLGAFLNIAALFLSGNIPNDVSSATPPEGVSEQHALCKKGYSIAIAEALSETISASTRAGFPLEFTLAVR